MSLVPMDIDMNQIFNDIFNAYDLPLPYIPILFLGHGLFLPFFFTEKTKPICRGEYGNLHILAPFNVRNIIISDRKRNPKFYIIRQPAI